MTGDPSSDGPAPLVADLAADDALRRVVRAARAWGVSPSRFLGREPARRTVYHYGPDGVLMAAETLTEPEWTPDDRALALQLADYEAELCDGCGHPLADTTDPDAEYRYEPGPAIRCHRCTAAHQAAALYEKSPHPRALHYTIRDRHAAAGPDDRTRDAATDTGAHHADHLDPAGG